MNGLNLNFSSLLCIVMMLLISKINNVVFFWLFMFIKWLIIEFNVCFVNEKENNKKIYIIF